MTATSPDMADHRHPRPIDPRPLWDDEEYGMFLRCVIAPDGVHYLTDGMAPHVMIREDQVDFTGFTWDDVHWQPSLTPEMPWWGRRPVAVRTDALFYRSLIEPLYAAGCTVWPLEQHGDSTRSAVHAVLIREDLIGYIMPNLAAASDLIGPLP